MYPIFRTEQLRFNLLYHPLKRTFFKTDVIQEPTSFENRGHSRTGLIRDDVHYVEMTCIILLHPQQYTVMSY